ncbi:MAG: hypothetical protein EBU70_09355 [Actinobacteria bacterium]|nr:hypothetical protein [Actinomycetota bacterium]
MLVASLASLLVASVPVAASAQPAAPQAPTAGATVKVVGSTRISDVGTTLVTVRGRGFANFATGSRPPLAGRPTGIYVVFGRFDEAWKPSAGAPASARRTVLESQRWVLPAESHQFVDPTGTNPAVVNLSADGSFTVQVPVSAIEGTGTYAIAVYPASGAINAAHEFLIPLTAGLQIAANSKVSATVKADSRSRCRISANGKNIEATAVGRCTVFVSVETGDTTVIKRIPLRITKK